MSENEFSTTDGKAIISTDVIASIAKTAALEVTGVAGTGIRTKDIRGWVGSGAEKSVRVVNNEKETVIDVHVNLKEGVRIPDVAYEIQRNVKTSIQSMTSKPVNKVNVYIEGIVFDTAEVNPEE